MSICNQYGVICKNKITEQYGMHFTECNKNTSHHEHL